MIFRGLVFIYKAKDLIKIFESSTRKEIGIALLAFEKFICKGEQVNNKDIQRITNLFDYYDEYLSDSFPSLTNEVLQDHESLIIDYFNHNKIHKEDYSLCIDSIQDFDDKASINVNIVDNTGKTETELIYFVKKENEKNDFNSLYDTCEKVQNHLKKEKIDKIIGNYHL